MRWQRFLVLDFVLIAIIAAGILRIRRHWQEFEQSHRVQSVQAEAEPVRALPGVATLARNAEDWKEIALKNPFSFDRNDMSIVAPAPGTAVRPKPVLFGVMSVGNERTAFLAPGQTGTRTSQPVKVGQMVDSWEVIEILEKSVVVTGADGVHQTIVMNDPSAQVARAYERTGTSGSTAPVNVVNSTPAAAPPAPATSAPAPPTAGQQTASPAPAEDEWLITPFGKVRRTRP